MKPGLVNKRSRDIIYLSVIAAVELILLCMVLLSCERKNLWENDSIATPVPPVEKPLSDFRLVSGSTANGQITFNWTDPTDLDEGGAVEIMCKGESIAQNDTIDPDVMTYTLKGLKSGDYGIAMSVKNSSGTEIAKADFCMTADSAREYYFIYTANDLDAVRGSSLDEYKGWDTGDCYNLMKDIDMSGAGNWRQIGDNSTGKDSSRFTGIFEGNYHTISKLIGNSAGDLFGLFGYVTGVVKNLILKDISISGNNGIGAIAGMNAGKIKNCTVTGNSSVAGKEEVGGMAGINTGTLSVLNSSAKVTGEKVTGGIAGECKSGSRISDCHVTGDVKGTNITGGLIGINKSEIPVSNSSSSGGVRGTMEYTGGFAGINEGTITECFSSGTVEGVKYTGGLTGKNAGTITNCNATGNVAGTMEYTGGFAGINEVTMTECYSSGAVEGVKYTGGLTGKNAGTITNCHATGNVTGTMEYTGGLAGQNLWIINGTGGKESYASGNVTGTDNTGGLIGGAGGNAGTGGGFVSSCYSSGKVTGSGSRVGGLVGSNKSGVFTGCRAVGTTVSGNISVGGFVGYSDIDRRRTWAEKCYSEYNVEGTAGVGGFAGANHNGDITNCYSRGNVTGSLEDTSGTGGFIGSNDSGDITCCYSTGLVSGPPVIGGFCGVNGEDESVRWCYFNADVLGEWAWEDTEKGNPRSAEDMVYPTYDDEDEYPTYVLWNFSTVWAIDGSTNDSYPYLMF